MYWHTVREELRAVLIAIMRESLFDPFRLVGGTSLSLQWGHRISVDIDLFTDAAYGTIDFDPIKKWIQEHYYTSGLEEISAMGTGVSCFAGPSADQLVKLDIYYTDPFIRPPVNREGLRLASQEDIIAMKLDIIGRGTGSGGRKKDFWDLHRARDYYSFGQMLSLYGERYPYGHRSDEIKKGLLDFSVADDDFEPVCLMGKHWELIKLDILGWLKEIG
jgi:hypothetical protein